MSQQHGRAIPKQHIPHTHITQEQSTLPWHWYPCFPNTPLAKRKHGHDLMAETQSSCRLFTEGRAKMQEDPKLSAPMAELPSSSGAIQHRGVRAQESTAQLTGQAVNTPVFPIFPLILVSQILHFVTTHTTHIRLIPAAHTL